MTKKKIFIKQKFHHSMKRRGGGRKDNRRINVTTINVTTTATLNSGDPTGEGGGRGAVWSSLCISLL
jgi:hypothetical protein